MLVYFFSACFLLYKLLNLCHVLIFTLCMSSSCCPHLIPFKLPSNFSIHRRSDSRYYYSSHFVSLVNFALIKLARFIKNDISFQNILQLLAHDIVIILLLHNQINDNGQFVHHAPTSSRNSAIIQKCRTVLDFSRPLSGNLKI